MSRRNPAPDGKIVLPITPMLDMVFQLLFFFIMNFNPADLEGQIEAALPAQDQVVGRPGVAPPNVPGPTLPADLTVEIRTGRDGGGISALSVRGADGKSTPIADLDALAKHLAAERAASNNAEAIKIRADARLSVENLMKVIDTCKGAGFTSTALVSPE